MIQSIPTAFNAIMVHERDNVATTIHNLALGARAIIRTPGGELVITLQEDIPACHKFSLDCFKAGSEVYKQGAFIGHATTAIETGKHVHTHNLAGRKASEYVASKMVPRSLEGNPRELK